MFAALQRLVAVSAIVLSSVAVAAAGHAAPSSITSTQQLATMLTAASSVATLPPTTSPAVSKESTDYSGWGNCLLDYSGPGTLAAWPGEKACSFGDVTSKKTIVLFGDSQVWQWSDALDRIGKKNHVKMVLLARSACDLASVVQWDYYSVADSKNCYAFANLAVKKIASMHPWGIVVAFIKIPTTETLSHQLLSSAQYSGYLAERLKQLVAITPHVFLMDQHPVPAQNPATCIAIHPTQLLHCGIARSAPNQAMNEPDFAVAARAAGASFVPQANWYCSSSYCPVVLGTTLMYLDQYHFTKTFTVALTPILEAALRSKGMLP